MSLKEDISVLILHFGYVESANISFTAYTTDEEGMTKAQALRSLANILYQAYKEEHDSPSMRGCCAKARKRSKKPKFCPDCGSNLSVKGLSVEEFSRWIRYAHEGDVDNYSGMGLRDILETPWTPWTSFSDFKKVKDNQFLEIIEKAEDVLAMAVDPGIMSPEDRDVFEEEAKNPYRCFYFGDKLEDGVKNGFSP